MSNNLEKRRYNYTTSFILPMLGHPMSHYSGLVDAYLADFAQDNTEWNFNKIFVLTLHDNSQLRYNPYYIDSYPQGDRFMYVFEIPLGQEDNYQLFIIGKYSLISQDYKDYLVSRIERPDIQNHTLYKILYKTPDGRRQIEERIGVELPPGAEVASVPSLDRETFGYVEVTAALNQTEE